MSNTKYWIATISQEHANRGIQGQFIQVCHGKQAPLKRMQKDDHLLIYAPKIAMEGKEPYQKFMAIGKVADDAIYPFAMTEHFRPFRRNIHFLNCTPVSIQPMIPHLEFIKDKKRWGYPFRFGLLEISEKDFQYIADKMMSHE